MSTTHTPTPAFEITAAERRTRRGLMASLVFDRPGTADVEGWFASIEMAGEGSFDLSKLDGEDGWTIDGVYGPTGLPGFVNGFGARYLATKRLVAEASAVVDAYVAALA